MRKSFRFLSMAFMALTLSFAATSCGDDGDDISDGTSSSDGTSNSDGTSSGSSKKDLGNGIYLINGHRFVDLGLPSGLLWAETNIGSEKPADDGYYFAWGETTSKSTYDWSTYKYGTSDNLTKYDLSDMKFYLDKEDDAAYVNWGAPCRIPTDAQFAELRNTNNCTWTWTTKTASDESFVNGYVVSSVKNGNSIFLPASGCRSNGDLYRHGSYGLYWSSTLFSSYCNSAYYLSFYSSKCNQYYGIRYYGLPVRPVAEP